MVSKSSANPASGPECSVPATGWAGTRCTPLGRCGATWRMTAPLTEPTSVTMAPGMRPRPDRLSDGGIGPHRRAQNHQIGILNGGGHVGFGAIAEA